MLENLVKSRVYRYGDNRNIGEIKIKESEKQIPSLNPYISKSHRVLDVFSLRDK